MFKKIFGPKKFEAQGAPVPLEDMRNLLLSYFPREGEINSYLTIDKTKKVNEGFEARWEFFTYETDTEGDRQRVLLKHTVFVDIRPDENAVYFKTRHLTRTKRPPRREKVYDFWQSQVRIGKLETLMQEKPSRFVFYNAKKILQPLVDDVTSHGWDAYR
jgi:hypothetical protein